MSFKLCTITPKSNRTDIKNTRQGRSYDWRRGGLGHATFSLITSVDPPILRFWEPYIDITISRQDAALLIRETRKNRGIIDNYHHQLESLGTGIKTSTLKFWADHREEIYGTS